MALIKSSNKGQTYCTNCEDRVQLTRKPRARFGKFQLTQICRNCGEKRLLWIPPPHKDDAPNIQQYTEKSVADNLGST